MIGVIGGTILLLGVALIFLPGPAFLVIPAGLGILATEFAWAKRWTTRIKEFATRKSPGTQKERNECVGAAKSGFSNDKR